MQTITHTRGTTVGDPLTLTDDDGAALDLTGCTVTAHVQVGGTCRDLVATIPDPLIGEAWLDWDALDVPQRALHAAAPREDVDQRCRQEGTHQRRARSAGRRRVDHLPARRL